MVYIACYIQQYLLVSYLYVTLYDVYISRNSLYGGKTLNSQETGTSVTSRRKCIYV